MAAFCCGGSEGLAWFLQPPTQLGAVIGLVADERCDALPVAMSHSEPGQSSASPPVRRMARRRPRASAGTFVLRPPLSPFSTRCRAARWGRSSRCWPISHLRPVPEQIFPDSAPQPVNTRTGVRAQRFGAKPRKIPSTHRLKDTRRSRLSPGIRRP
jgi:hypothetical protein